jgi:hypothetical protein
MGWELEQDGAARLDDLSDAGDFVNTDVIHDDDVTAPKRRNRDLLCST